MEKFTDSHRLAIVVSHPIQYYAPLFSELAKEINLKVFYCFNPSSDQQGKDGFGISFKWDVDLFEGYDYEFLNNVSKRPSSSYRSGCDTPNVGEALDLFNPSHVVTFGWHLKSFQQVLRYCKRNSIPIAVRGDSKVNKNESMIKRIIKKIYYPLFLNNYSAFLSVGKENTKYLLKYGVPQSKIIFSPHAVDQVFWSGKGKKSKKFRFIWVAKFIPLKRPFDAIDAFMKLYELNQDIELIMVGSGPLLERSKKRAENCRGISFLGFKNQMELKKEYLSSDVLVLTSDSETWGLVVNESLSIGLKVIVSSEIGCSPDLINTETGLIYEVGSINSLSNAMSSLYKKRKEIKNFQAFREVNSTYSFKRNVVSFKKVFNYEY